MGQIVTDNIISTSFTVNDRIYAPPPRPVVVICVDGCGDEYLSTSMAAGCMPRTLQLAAKGYRGMARGALPSFTNVNNCAMVTGVSPAKTGIGGNYIIDPDTGEEVMTNSSKFLRTDTILAAASNAGRKVAMITAKDKLRELLSIGMKGIAFSSEKSNEVTLDVNGINDVESLVGPTPSIYSGDASLYVLRAGVALLQAGRSDFLYLSLTDYMQHKYAPDAPESLDFYNAIDNEIGKLIDLGALIGMTADHGMNAKCDENGEAKIIYVETELIDKFGAGYRVICPITDPYVVHHGALGSAVTVYLPANADRDAVSRWLLEHDGITEVYDREMAAKKLELPADRIGDLFVLSARDVVLGRTPAHHDLSKLEGTLRSHGGRYEEMVPLLISEPLTCTYRGLAGGDPRNFDIFDYVCNGVAV